MDREIHEFNIENFYESSEYHLDNIIFGLILECPTRSDIDLKLLKLL